MSGRKGTGNNNYGYDKFAEHSDQTPLGKLQHHYWTTKQQMIKKLGKKEDEYVVMSDAELDAKLDMFEAIQINAIEMLRVIEIYQNKIIALSLEEGEMGAFLKSQAHGDNKTRAGKMMAAVGKAQNFASQQRMSLRLPLVRLYNEVETFLHRAIADTLLTIRKMEKTRTEYRGALLWMKNVSQELDPDAGKKLEKFRRVQNEVKRAKTKFDRLKTDVTEKVDLLSASRCNMFSHVLVHYQTTLIQFWEKTAKTMNAVAEAFKGYQYYEFNVIKDLNEPSKRVAKMVNQKAKDDTKNASTAGDDSLIEIEEETPNDIKDLFESQQQQKKSQNSSDNKPLEDQVNELIDLMTTNEAPSLNEQLRELEQLELAKKQKSHVKQQQQQETAAGIASKLAAASFDLSSLIKSSSGAAAAAAVTASDLDDLATLRQASANATAATEGGMPGSPLDSPAAAFNMRLKAVNDEFEREWQSVFAGDNKQQSSSQQSPSAAMSPTALPGGGDSFGFFQFETNQNSANASGVLSMPSQLLEKKTTSSVAAEATHPATTSLANKKSNTNWFDLFADLDPLKNPDTIGKDTTAEDERNC